MGKRKLYQKLLILFLSIALLSGCKGEAQTNPDSQVEKATHTFKKYLSQNSL